MVQIKGNLPEHPGGAWHLTTVRQEVGSDPRNGKIIHATRPEWGHLDPAVTPDSITTAPKGAASSFRPLFQAWLKSYFASRGSAPISEARDAAMRACGITMRWWDDHSSEYLEKRNESGIWMCRPRLDL